MTTRPGNSAPNQARFNQQTFIPAAEPLKAIQLSSDLNHNHADLDAYAPGEAPNGLASLKAFLVDASTQLDQLNHLRTHPDPQHPEHAHVLKVSELGDKTISRLGKAYDSANSAIRSAIEGYEADLVTTGRLVPTAQAAELRSIIRGMDEAERFSTLMIAIENKQFDIVAAAVSAPGLASGLTEKQLTAIREHHLRQVAPGLLDKRRAAQVAQSKLTQAFDSLLSQAPEFTARHRADEIKAQQAEAKKHDAALGRPSWGQ